MSSFCFTTQHKKILPSRSSNVSGYTFYMETRNQKKLREVREEEERKKRLNRPTVYIQSLLYKKPLTKILKNGRVVIAEGGQYYTLCRAFIEVGGKKYGVKDLHSYYYTQTIRFEVENEYYMLEIKPKSIAYIDEEGDRCYRSQYEKVLFGRLVKYKSIEEGRYEVVDYEIVCPNVFDKLRKLSLKQRKKTLKKTIYDIGFCKDVAGIISEYVM